MPATTAAVIAFSRPVSVRSNESPSVRIDATSRATEMLPRVGRPSPDASRSSVDLPAPFGPISPTLSPGPMRSDTSRSAQTGSPRRMASGIRRVSTPRSVRSPTQRG